MLYLLRMLLYLLYAEPTLPNDDIDK